MKIKFIESVAGSEVSFRPGETYEIEPNKKPGKFTEFELLKMQERGILMPADDEAKAAFEKFRKGPAGKRLETATTR